MFTGHPRGLFRLFFIEMWERLAFYMLVGILVLYASDAERGGLGLTLAHASRIYGTYLAFVYFTPFLGGMLADRVLGYRRAVFIGGIIFAVGLVLLGIPGKTYFYGGLVLLCVGNGLFKPNISAMVGNLYEKGDPKRDAGFNIFYMGINIGAATANLAAAPIRNLLSWQWAFWMAAAGMCIGVLLLVISWRVLERADCTPEPSPEDTSFGEIVGKILLPAVLFGAAGYYLAASVSGWPIASATNGFLFGMIPVIYFFIVLPGKQREEERDGLRALLPVFLAGGTFFMILHLNGSALTAWANKRTDRQVAWAPAVFTQEALPSYFEAAAVDVPRPDRRSLLEVDAKLAKMFGTKKMTETAWQELASRNDLSVVVVWTPDGVGVDAAAAQAPSTLTDLLATYVYPDDAVVVEEKKDAEGKTRIEVELKDGAHPTRKIAVTRLVDGRQVPLFLATGSAIEAVYSKVEGVAGGEALAPGEFVRVVNPEVYQSWNPIWVVVLTPLIVAFFAALVRRGRGVSTPRKIFYGMLLTAGAMLVMAGAGAAFESNGTRVAGLWLVSAYFVITIGELCLSPMGLSLVTKLSPKRLVGLMMGGWFCATAFGNKLSGFFGELETKVAPTTFFSILAGAAVLVAVVVRLLLPWLERTMQRYSA
ncbi:MAG: peptide MFS transporter [Planctomycetota bacterium]